jgi:hypothetical protein
MPGMSTGFLQLRRGLFEHVKDGRVSFFEASLYVAILSDANPSTGVCYGSAGLFAALYSLSSRTCRDALEKLEEKGYLRRFPTRGKHGSYPILVNKFRCSDGAMKGKYVNCSKSIDCNKITYDLCDDGVNEGAVASVNEGVNDSAVRVDTRDKKQDINPLSLSATPPQIAKVRLQDFPETWNRLCGTLPKIENFSDSRKKQVVTRIRQGITVERFEQSVVCCTQKPFLRGENDRNWNATFDWLIKNDRNIEKAITESYGTNNGGNKSNGKTDRAIETATKLFNEYENNAGTHGIELLSGSGAN